MRVLALRGRRVMARRRPWQVAVLVGLAAVVATGCLRIDLGIVVDDPETVTISTRLTMPPTLLALVGGETALREAVDFEQALGPDALSGASGIEVETTETQLVSDSDGWRGILAEASFPLDALDMASVDAPQITPTDDGGWRFSWQSDAPLAEMPGGFEGGPEAPGGAGPPGSDEEAALFEEMFGEVGPGDAEEAALLEELFGGEDGFGGVDPESHEPEFFDPDSDEAAAYEEMFGGLFGDTLQFTVSVSLPGGLESTNSPSVRTQDGMTTARWEITDLEAPIDFLLVTDATSGVGGLSRGTLAGIIAGGAAIVVLAGIWLVLRRGERRFEQAPPPPPDPPPAD